MQSNKTLLAVSLVAALGFAAAASAQTTPPPSSPVSPSQQTQPTQQTPPTRQTQPMQSTQSKPGFSQLDSNHDGKLERSEIPSSMPDLRSHYMQYDLDHNGSLSAAEYGTYVHPAPAQNQQY